MHSVPKSNDRAPIAGWFMCGVACLPGILLFVVLRVVAVQNAVLLEDHDSVSYLYRIGVSSGLWSGELRPEANADDTPLYPFVAQLLVRSGMQVETAARATSVIFTLAGFLSMLGIAHRYGDLRTVCVLGVLLAVAPCFVEFDIGVITEPVYVGIVYVGLWLYARKFAHGGNLVYAFILGAVFAGTFLARAEGLMFVVLIPLFHATAMWYTGRLREHWKSGIVWTAVFVVGFLLVAAPQIASVSRIMGTLAINGRQAWIVALDAPGDAGYAERMVGLDYSPAVTNIDYLKRNPVAVAELKAQMDTPHRFKTMIRKVGLNGLMLLKGSLNELVGLVNLLFVGMGLLAIVGTKRQQPLWIWFGLGVALTIPALLHTALLRHILALAPMLLLCASIGIVAFADRAASAVSCGRSMRLVEIAVMCLCVMLAATSSVIPIKFRILDPPTENGEYAPYDMQPMVEVIRRETPHGVIPVVMARKGYLGHLSGARRVMSPWTDYAGLVLYARMNQVDFFYSQANLNGKYPFMEDLRKGADQFELLYAGQVGRSRGFLYRFHAAPNAAASDAAKTAEKSVWASDG